MWGKEDSEKDGWLAAEIGAETELNVANFTGVKCRYGLRDFVPKLVLLNETAGNRRHDFLSRVSGEQIVRGCCD